MKNIVLFSLSAFTLALLSSCTKNFQADNTNPNAATQQQLNQDYLSIGGYITQMEEEIVPCKTNDGNNDLNNYQLMYNLSADNYSGQQGPSDDFGNNDNNNTYDMASHASWSETLFNQFYLNEMTPWATVKLKAVKSEPYAFAVAQILKVLAMSEVTDAYGPVPYTKFQVGALSTSYDSQETIYHTFFTEIDTAVNILNVYIKNNPGQTPLAKIDMIYASNFTEWVKLANSIKLRLAMRIVYIDPATAKTEAEAAVAGGVMTANTDNALIAVGANSLANPLYGTCYTYGDTRMGATMESFLKGYHDPRAPLLFDQEAVPAGSTPDYHGIRTGIDVITASYRPYSPMNIQANTPVQLMAAPEIYFLRAEGALRGWNMNGTAQSLYETGIQTSFSQNIGGGNASAGAATSYLADNTSMPAPYVDPVTPSYSIPAGDPRLSTITIKWNPMVPFETNLERIITQKWIALFPQGFEAWTEFRRTGYPKIFPVAVNNSGGLISTQTQIRRLPFPQSEYQANNAAVTQAVQLLGGPDNGGTKLWWDKNPNH
jgi:hypothetical protein